ncbi:hypothetical protein CBS63078_3467 [Aspergillus niger]|nr:hypothetical protein CBS63078_3467 [Aspergillus niger]GLA16607.1 hypothetical protein AnigIFM62618_003200 [Aspergillus niger]
MERRLRNTSCDSGNGAVGDHGTPVDSSVANWESCLSEAPLCDGLLLSHLGSIVFGPCRSSAAGSYVIPSKPPSLLVHSAAILKSSSLTLPILPSKDSCFSSETTLLQTSTSYTMRAATLLLVALSAVALALPTTNNVERAAADANVRQMDELTVAAISK